MAVKSGVYAQPLLLSLTAGTGPPDWDLTGANGDFVILTTAGADEAKFESTTTADIVYTGGTWGATELSTGHGYTAAGIQVPTPAVSVVTGDIVKYTSANIVWTATDATGWSITTGGGLLFYMNPAAGSKYLFLQITFSAGTYTVAGNGATFTVQPSGTGLLTLTLK